jgi:hypothetical protein
VAPLVRSVNAELRAKLIGTNAHHFILTVARLDKQKGLNYLLEAAALIPEAMFVLAGEGPERPALEAHTRALSLNNRVVFLGYRADIDDLLASCDLFVLPSLFEGLPLSVLEAMAAGKPVVATAIGGTDETIIHGETGLLVPPADPFALAGAIRTALADPSLSRRLGAAGRARVHQQFSAESMVRRITEIYDEILDSRGAQHGADIQREDKRNRLLRRADWRFLLPNPKPVKTICFATGFLARATAFISDSIVDGPVDDSRHCDLAVAVDPDRVTLQQAWDALDPGGSLYIEWYSPLTGGSKRVCQRLEEAGFVDVTCYWPWPSLNRSYFWLPLHAPSALQYFKTNRLRVRALVSRIGAVVRQAPWRLSLWLGLTLPFCATARKPGLSTVSVDDKPSTVIPLQSASDTRIDLLAAVKAGWTSWGFAPANHLSSLLLTGGPRSGSKVVRLVFADQESRPRIAIKISRVPECIPTLLREATALRTIRSLRPNGMAGIPRVLFCREEPGLVILGESALTGRPLWTLLDADNYHDIALQATTWLADFVGRPQLRPRSQWWNRLIEPVIADFSESFGPILDRGMLRETDAILNTLDSLPVVCEHRDFSPWNILVDSENELIILDWESTELQGLPAIDLIYFLTYLAFYVSGAWRSKRFRKSYRATLDPSTLTGNVLNECMTRYFNRTGLESNALGPLRLLTWMLHSRSEYRHFVADVAGKPGPAILRRSLFFKLWEEELRAQKSASDPTLFARFSRLSKERSFRATFRS